MSTNQLLCHGGWANPGLPAWRIPPARHHTYNANESVIFTYHLQHSEYADRPGAPLRCAYTTWTAVQ